MEKCKNCKSRVFIEREQLGEKLFSVKCRKCGSVVIRTSEDKALACWNQKNSEGKEEANGKSLR